MKALERTARDVGYSAALLQAVESVNGRQKQRLVEKIRDYFHGELAGKTFALWGLAFKPNTDDMRDASSRVIMEALWAAGARVRAYDPVAMQEAQRLYPDQTGLVLCNDTDETLQGADALIIVTEWNVFRSPDFDRLKSMLTHPVIFDGRNLYDPSRMQTLGFDYFGIGRGLSAGAAT